MVKPPILTVLLLTYNHENTIATALDSVLQQKTKYSYIIWLAEDCSTDGTLKICKEYVKKYPTKIKLIAQAVNTKSAHLREALCRINTEYFTILEGDDRWCDTNKIQIAVKTLEANPKYITFAHDTFYNDIPHKTQKSLVHDIHKATIHNPVDMYSAPYLHTSARIHRNAINLRKHFKKLKHAGDLYLFYSFLDKGPLYYYDKIMSVYNIDGRGMWSQLSEKEQAISTDSAYYKCNTLLNYRHDSFFTEKVRSVKRLEYYKRVFGVKLGWRAYILVNSQLK